MLILILLLILILILMMLNVECWLYIYIHIHIVTCIYYHFLLCFVTSIIIYYHLFKHYLLIYYCSSYEYHCWYWTFYQQYLGGQLLFHEDHLLREDKKILVYQETKGNCPKDFHTEKSCTTWGCSSPARKFVGKSDISINAALSICWISHWEYQ